MTTKKDFSGIQYGILLTSYNMDAVSNVLDDYHGNPKQIFTINQYTSGIHKQAKKTHFHYSFNVTISQGTTYKDQEGLRRAIKKYYFASLGKGTTIVIDPYKDTFLGYPLNK